MKKAAKNSLPALPANLQRQLDDLVKAAKYHGLMEEYGSDAESVANAKQQCDDRVGLLVRVLHDLTKAKLHKSIPVLLDDEPIFFVLRSSPKLRGASDAVAVQRIEKVLRSYDTYAATLTEIKRHFVADGWNVMDFNHTCSVTLPQ